MSKEFQEADNITDQKSASSKDTKWVASKMNKWYLTQILVVIGWSQISMHSSRLELSSFTYQIIHISVVKLQFTNRRRAEELRYVFHHNSEVKQVQ